MPAMLNDRSSALALLATRRSGKPRDLVAPGPDEAQLRQMLTIGMRVPDHGKLAPWRFVIIPQDRRAALATLIEDAYRAERPEAGRLEIESLHQFAHQAPTLVAILSTPVVASKIPLWEQQLSAGAACMTILNAAHAIGYAGGWLSGWPAYSDAVRDALGGGADDRIAGFLFIGTPGSEPEERPRPGYDKIVSIWTANAAKG
jgi:nitroreductase